MTAFYLRLLQDQMLGSSPLAHQSMPQLSSSFCYTKLLRVILWSDSLLLLLIRLHFVSILLLLECYFCCPMVHKWCVYSDKL